jgi:hypothetical protein
MDIVPVVISVTSASRTGTATSRTPDFPELFDAYARAFAGRYPRLQLYTPVNEASCGRTPSSSRASRRRNGGRTRWSWTPARRATHRGPRRTRRTRRTRRECCGGYGPRTALVKALCSRRTAKSSQKRVFVQLHIEFCLTSSCPLPFVSSNVALADVRVIQKAWASLDGLARAW